VQTHISSTEDSLAKLKEDLSAGGTATMQVEVLEREVDALTENLSRLPLSLPAFTQKPFPCKSEVLSSIIALDYVSRI